MFWIIFGIVFVVFCIIGAISGYWNDRDLFAIFGVMALVATILLCTCLPIFGRDAYMDALKKKEEIRLLEQQQSDIFYPEIVKKKAEYNKMVLEMKMSKDNYVYVMFGIGAFLPREVNDLELYDK